MTIGYCPTMEEYVKQISNLQDFEIVNLGSAARVLYSLQTGEIDVGIVGRKAKKTEFVGYEKVDGSGYTLITHSKSAIPEDELPGLKIDTYIPKEIVEKEFSELQHVVYHKTLKEALEKGHVQLIDWNDWDDAFALLIPVNGFGNKNKKFRVPHIYSKQDVSDQLKL